MTTTETTPEIQALAAHLEESHEDAESVEDDYLVLTDEDADEQAAEYIRDSVWAFTAWFIADHAPDSITSDHIDSMRGDSCEDCNDAMVALVDAGSGMDSFIEDAISADGRAHFMNSYDGEEDEQDVDGTTYFIYRMN